MINIMSLKHYVIIIHEQTRFYSLLHEYYGTNSAIKVTIFMNIDVMNNWTCCSEENLIWKVRPRSNEESLYKIYGKKKLLFLHHIYISLPHCRSRCVSQKKNWISLKLKTQNLLRSGNNCQPTDSLHNTDWPETNKITNSDIECRGRGLISVVMSTLCSSQRRLVAEL